MTTAHLLAVAWSPDPSVFGGTVALLVAYGAWLGRRLDHRAWSFLAGVLVLVFALVSPIDRLGELYLFSVHMLQHLLLILVVPPLLIWGLPPDATRKLLTNSVVARLEGWLGNPFVALPAAVVALWAWHVPALYDLTLRNETIHALEHLLFLVTATMFWWPVLTPVPSRRLSPPASMAYLFAAMVSDALLGAALTLAPSPLYSFYLHPPDPYGALAMIRNAWNISTLSDQQMGGLAMWIPGSIFYITAILIEFGRWFAEPEVDGLETPRQPEPKLVSEADMGAADTTVGASSPGASGLGTACVAPTASRILWTAPAARGGIPEGAR